MDWEEAFEYRPEFAVGETPEEAKRLFKGRLYACRKLVKENKGRAATELELLRQDRAALPPSSHNHRGEPRWEGSLAQFFLKQDVKNKHHETMSRNDFYDSCTEYAAFLKTTISKHIDQEVRYQKFLAQYGARRNFF